MRNSQRNGVRQYNKSDFPRLRWTPELHEHFAQAVEQLGGKYKATPKRILQMMNVKGLKLSHIKSHLQMYRSLKNHNGNDVLLTLKNLQTQRAQCKNHGDLPICFPKAQRQVGENVDWENDRRSNYVKYEVFCEESNGLLQANASAGEDEHRVRRCACLLDSRISTLGKMSKEAVDGFNENCLLSLSFNTPSMVMMRSEEERQSWLSNDGHSHQSSSLDYNFINSTPDVQSVRTSNKLNLDLTI